MNNDNKNLTNSAINGFKWNFLSVIVVATVQIGYAAIMARLIAPEAFGLVAMANVILRFGTYFSRMGIGSAIIQKKELTDDDTQAAFTAALVFGLAVTLLIIICAPLGKLIFNDEQVVPVVRVMATTLFITGISTTANSLLRRAFRFKEIAIAEITSFILGAGGVGFAMAYLGFGTWSLIFSSIAQGIILALICYAYSRHSLKLTFDLNKYKPILAFGSKISIISFLEFVCYNLDSMVIGRIAGAEMLGYYNRANYLVNTPANKISTSLTNVLFPSLSRLQGNKEKLRKAYTSTISVLGTFLFIYAFAVSAASHEIILVILGHHWAPAIPLLSVLAIAVPFSLLKSINGILLEATAKLNFKIIVLTAYLITLILIFIAFFPLMGVVGFAWAYFSCEFIYYFVYLIFIIRMLEFKIEEIIKLNLSIFVAGVVSFLVIYFSRAILTQWNMGNISLLLFDLLISLVMLLLFYYIAPSKIVRNSVSNILFSSQSNIQFLNHLIERLKRRYQALSQKQYFEVFK